MKRQRPNVLGRSVTRFFQEYLPALRGMSAHTIHSYRDALVLFFQFRAKRARKAIADLDLPDITAAQVTDFLSFLEAERQNGIATRNARLAAIHTFARFLSAEQPQYLAELQCILGIPFKRGARRAPIEYLELEEVEALLRAIDRRSPAGRRDVSGKPAT